MNIIEAKVVKMSISTHPNEMKIASLEIVSFFMQNEMYS